MEAERPAWVMSPSVSWAAVRGGTGGIGGEEKELGAGEVVALFVWTAICGGEGGSSEVGDDEMELGAGAGEEWSGVPNVSVGGHCGESGMERLCSRFGEDAGVGLGGSSDRAGRGGVYGGGERRRSLSTPMPLSNSTLQRLFATFLIRFTGGGKGASGDLGGEGWGGGGLAGGGPGRIGDGTAGAGEVRVLGSDCTAELAT